MEPPRGSDPLTLCLFRYDGQTHALGHEYGEYHPEEAVLAAAHQRSENCRVGWRGNIGADGIVYSKMSSEGGSSVLLKVTSCEKAVDVAVGDSSS